MPIETAYAKLNLALHVRERMPDGYHRIETLFAFCEDGDRLTLTPGKSRDTLTLGGPFARDLKDEPDNLVLAAARLLRAWAERAPGAEVPAVNLHLDKRLPVASGIGGGSADAGAAMRLLARHWNCGEQEDLPVLARSLGADVPACLVSRTRIGSGRGDDLAPPGADDVAGLPVLLVNPRTPLSTAAVFAGWDGVDHGPLPDGSVLSAARAGRNDLEASAVAICPAIGDVLACLRDMRPLLARMSGSGATCFALFADAAARDAADAEIARREPRWWRMASCLR